MNTLPGRLYRHALTGLIVDVGGNSAVLFVVCKALRLLEVVFGMKDIVVKNSLDIFEVSLVENGFVTPFA